MLSCFKKIAFTQSECATHVVMSHNIRRNAFTLAEGATHVVMSHNIGRDAFTLAEVLVTLGVIGVVSALTIPTLVGNYQKKTYITKLNKVYSGIQQAAVKYKNDKNAVNLREAGLTSQAEIKNFLQNNFKVVADCGSVVKEPCFSASYNDLNGGSHDTNDSWGAASSVLLADGTGIIVDYPAYYTQTVDGVTSYHGHMIIDVNGPQGPNIGGRDIFLAEFYDDGSIDVEGATPECKSKGVCTENKSIEDIRESYYNANCRTARYGTGCIGKIINDNWEMNY